MLHGLLELLRTTTGAAGAAFLLPGKRTVAGEVPELRDDGTTDAPIPLARRSAARGMLVVAAPGAAAEAVDAALTLAARALELGDAEERLDAVALATTDAIYDWDMEAGKLWWSDGMATRFGHPVTLDELSEWAARIHAEDRERVSTSLQRAIESGEARWQAEYRFAYAAGGWALVVDRGFFVRRNGQAVRMVGSMTDVTEQRRLEEQLLRAQRLESIGTLASGIAHDLNNVLSPILVSAGILRERVGDGELRAMVDIVADAARRGSDLVRQVVQFSRGVEHKRDVVAPAKVLRELERIVTETFPKTYGLLLEIPDDVWPIRADGTQLHQVLLNLVLNARDAMPNGGRVVIIVENVTLDTSRAPPSPELKPGRYVVIGVTDEGDGIPRDVLPRIFDPFFTTKPPGRGTGLGLSTVLAIVRAHGGCITVDTDAGVGAAFSVWLPAADSRDAAAVRPLQQLPRGHGETILVVDDEASIRFIARHALEGFGYRVLLASDGADGVARFQEHKDEVAAVVMDMRMPVMDGPAAMDAIHAVRSGVPVIAASGLLADEQPFAGARATLPKPYTVEELLVAVERVLHSKA